MKSKSTLKKAVKFVNNCKYIFFLPKNIFQKNIFSFTLFLISSVSFAQSGLCKTTLEVEKNRNYSNAGQDGAYFTLVLTNEGNSTDIYNLNAFNVNSACSNNDGSSSSDNVNLNSVFLDDSSSQITSITVPSHQTATFSIHLTVPQGTTYNRWNCTQINAVSTNCSNYTVNTVVHTIVNNPSEN
ncbi:hypothetical protein [Flavobacterium defluvii]|uniref:Fn3-like domain-containing protein n=1 Tax=Flavobacterium defluvii TaxID=370979 RepID=A0A1M5VH63_9FLAO|nr:hypothetical protein [Flavobacterium defluvii]SHH74550.1 hypothetical protein SAMN05443663_1112 [Flavobacterium defluvii]